MNSGRDRESERVVLPDWRAIAEASDRRNDRDHQRMVAATRRPQATTVRSPAIAQLGPGDPLRLIPPPVAFEILFGLEVPRSGFVRCPLPGHDDRTPSCKAFADPDRGFYCWGCNRGGTLVDLGAHLWGISPRGAGYFEIRSRLAAALLGREGA